VGDLSVSAGSPQQTVPLSGISSGATNETQTLTISAISSSPALTGTPSITYSNPASTGTLQFTPASSGAGTATITITADDGGASNNIMTRVLTVYVRASDNATPTISAVADQSTVQGTPVTIDFQVRDN